MKITKSELKKLIAEEIKTVQVDEGAADWIKGIFTSEEEINDLARRFEDYWYPKLYEFWQSDGALGAGGEYTEWDAEKGEDEGGVATKRHIQAHMGREAEYEEQWDEITALWKEARQALKALDYKSLQGFWAKPKKLDNLYKGMDAVQKALGIISKEDESYRDLAFQARKDASEAGRARVAKRRKDRMDHHYSTKATASADAERNRRQAAERARNRGEPELQFTGGQMSTHSPYQESVSQDKLKKIIAEELKAVLESK